MIKPFLLCFWAGMLLQTEGVLSQSLRPAATDSIRRAPLKNWPDEWLGKDKFDHALVSAGLVAAQFYFLRQELAMQATPSRQIAASSALALGLAKEIYDKASGRGTPSWKDLLADVVGIGVAVLLVTN